MLAPFLDPIALAIVGGGTIVATLLRVPIGEAGRAIVALRALVRPWFDAAPLLEQIAVFGRIARRHGPTALNRSVIHDADVAIGMAHVVDGTPAEEVEAELNHFIVARAERHLAVADVWQGMAEVAPAMGMVGTLIGLVTMFTQMTDPKAIGGAMAIALLATLYGALIANLVAAPIAHRLRVAARREAFERQRLVAPIVAIATREAPRPVSFVPYVEDVLA